MQRSLLFWLLLLTTGPLCAQIIAREGFDYAPFNPLFCLEGGTEDGWAGAWVRTIGDDAILRRGNLKLPGTDATGAGTKASLEFVRAGIRYDRPLDLIQDDGGDLWVAALMDWRPGSAANNVGNITLTRSGIQAFTFGRKFGNRRIGMVWAGETRPTSEVMAEGLHWLVVRIQFSGDNREESVWLWVDPDPAAGEPRPEDAVLAYPRDGFPGPQLNSGINGAQLKVEGTPPLRTDFDELVLSRTFSGLHASLGTATEHAAFLQLPLRAFPNPSPGPVSVSWLQPTTDFVNAELVGLDGRLIATVAHQRFSAGEQRLAPDLARYNLPGGSYLLRLTTGAYVGTLPLFYQPH